MTTTTMPGFASSILLLYGICFALQLLHPVQQQQQQQSVVPPNRNASVVTALGRVRGACTTSACRYLNVPFAEPFARFKRSRVRTTRYPKEGVGGTEFGPSCHQFQRPDEPSPIFGPQSEYCLSLNVWSPAVSSGAPLPVIVWIYGGGFIVGSASEKEASYQTAPTYDGAQLAANGVVVVSIAYRLCVLGFFPNADGTGGANGFSDMLSALEWVQFHIARFGGDPNSVTLFGQSAGSVAVCTLAHMPKAQGLFQSVIAESGTCYPSGDVLLDAAEAKGVRASYLSKCGLNDSALHTMPAKELVKRTLACYPTFDGFFTSGVGQPSPDGDILPDTPVKLAPLPVDLLIGLNSAEYPLPSTFPYSKAQAYFDHWVGGKAASQALSHYGSSAAELGKLVSDACGQCQHARTARRFATRSGARVYVYLWDYPHDAAPHSAEVPAVFGNGGLKPLGIPDPPLDLVHATQRIWKAFAAGQELSEVVPGWPKVATGNAVQAMVLGVVEPRQVVPFENAEACPTWVAANDEIGGWSVPKMCFGIWFYGYGR